MDTVTTAIGGALLAKALPEEKRGPSGVWTVTLASIVPDSDIFFDILSNDPLSGLTQHRAFTHSLLGAAVIGPLLALAAWRLGRDKNYPRLLGLALLGLGWHLFTDLATSWGTMVFYPFNRDRVVWDVLFIIDFTFSAILLLPQVIAWTYRHPPVALRRGVLVWGALASFSALVISLVSPFFGIGFNWTLLAILAATLAVLVFLPRVRGWGFRRERAAYCRVGVAVLAIYLAICAVSHLRAWQHVERMATRRKLAVLSLGALPQALSPFRWTGLVLAPEGVYQSWFDLLDSSQPEFKFFPSTENRFVARARELPEVQTYLWFARFPVARYRSAAGRHIVEFADRRFNSAQNRNSGFEFRVVFDSQGRVLSRGLPER